VFSVLYAENICLAYFAGHFLIALEVYWFGEILVMSYLVLSAERCWFARKNSI